MSNTFVTETLLRLRIVAGPLKKWRELAGLSQKAVAKELNYGSPQFISNWERGRALPPMDVLPKLVTLYKIPPEELIHVLSTYQEHLFAAQRAQIREILSDEQQRS